MASDVAESEALARRFHMDIFNAGKLDVADEILASQFVFHLPDQDVPGAEGIRELATLFRTAFPDVQITHEDSIATASKVAIRWTARGTHRGNYMPPWDTPPTGREIHIQGIDWYHLRDGKIEEGWLEIDEVGVLQQMGVITARGS